MINKISIRTPVVMQGRLQRTETNLMLFKKGGDYNARKPTKYISHGAGVRIATSIKIIPVVERSA